MSIWNDHRQAHCRSGGIPKRFHLVWNHSQRPSRFDENIESLRVQHPDWEINDWDDSGIAEWLDIESGGRLERLSGLVGQAYADHAAAGVRSDLRQVSDLVRLGLVWRFGGVYVDWDYRWQKPLDPLLDGEACVMTAISSKYIANGLIAAEPNDPFIWSMIEGARLGTGPLGASDATGPRYVMRKYQEFWNDTAMAGCRILPPKMFYPYGVTNAIRGEAMKEYPVAIAVHEWDSRTH